MNTNGHPTKQADDRTTRSEPSAGASFSSLAHDTIELAELQAQLLVLDVKTATLEARTSLGLIVVAVCLLLGCIPVALFALAELFVAQFEWSRPVAFTVSAVVGLLLSGGAVGVAWSRFQVGLESLKRSREELQRNLNWIKSNLKRAKTHTRSS
jgi:lysylphosphatidylglycerol synthetase-like protein (DUF2156 family)